MNHLRTLNWVLINDMVEIKGKIISLFSNGSITIKLDKNLTHDGYLTNSTGTKNDFYTITCYIDPKITERFGHFDQKMADCIGKRVTIQGSLVEDPMRQHERQIYPANLIVISQGISNIEVEKGQFKFYQPIHDLKVFGITNDAVLDELNTIAPPFNKVNKSLTFNLLFPRRPTLSAVPIFRLYEDTKVDQAERVIIFPPIFVDENRASLEIHIETGSLELDKGYFYGEFGLSYDEDLNDICDPNECMSDPGFSCQYTGEFRYGWTPMHFPTALAGDLVFSPDNGEGTIGTILSALDPFQVYDHCGIFIDDGYTLRHCTAANDRLKNEQYWEGVEIKVNIPFVYYYSQKTPSDGIRPDILKYAWPGTITQSAEEAFNSGENSQNPKASYWAITGRPQLPDFELPLSIRRDSRKFIDAELNSKGEIQKYNLTQLKNVIVEKHKMDEQEYNTILLKPTDERVRPYLKELAIEATKIDGHYRFYAYSDAKIALEPSSFAPSESFLPLSSKWAANTPGLVCSSFIWLAFRKLKEKYGNMSKFQMEGHRLEPEDISRAAKITNESEDDGLYVYGAKERMNAANKLYNKVWEEADKKISDSLDSIGKIGVAAYAAYNPLDMIALKNTPSVLASQMVMTFAKDDPKASNEWQVLEKGLAVSPDDILRSWDEPNSEGDFFGLYGKSVVLPKLENGINYGWGSIPIYKKMPSDGTGTIRGNVYLNQIKVNDAIVKLNCKKVVTPFNLELGYSILHNSGKYTIQAFWNSTKKPNVMLQSEVMNVEILKNTSFHQDIKLIAPPVQRFFVNLHLHADMEDETLFSTRRASFEEARGIELKYNLLDEFDITPSEQLRSKLDGEIEVETGNMGSGVFTYAKLEFSLNPNTMKLEADLIVSLIDREQGLFNSYEVDGTKYEHFQIDPDKPDQVYTGFIESDDVLQERTTFKVTISFVSLPQPPLNEYL